MDQSFGVYDNREALNSSPYQYPENLSWIPNPPLNSLVESNKWTNLGYQSLDMLQEVSLQFFIKMLSGKYACMRDWIWDWVQMIKKNIKEHMGIPVGLQNIIYEG